MGLLSFRALVEEAEVLILKTFHKNKDSPTEL